MALIVVLTNPGVSTRSGVCEMDGFSRVPGDS